MSFRKELTLLPFTLAIAACGSAPEAMIDVAEEQQAIVRGTTDEGHQAVMALDIFNLDGTETFCSATLYAPRTLVTAAHCMQDAGGALAYHGDDFFGDFEQLFGDPAAWENWALSVDWQLHPHWDPATLDSDIAVVHLDREMPFQPIPLERHPLNVRDLGRKVEIVGYGASGVDEFGFPVDALVKRSGKTVYEGSPRRFPAPPNPHPGLNQTRIRKQLMELEGSAPRATACFGDSGGPALIRVGNKQRLVGVSSFGGDGCDDYAYYVRVSKFMPFLIKGAKSAP